MSPSTPSPAWDRLVSEFTKRPDESLVVAFSGGLDSSVLLDAAVAALGRDRVVAFTAVSPSLSLADLEDVRRIAAELNVKLHEEPTFELDDPQYVANQGDRCYFCKRELFSVIGRVKETMGITRVAYGYHRDDDADFRPGLKAALEAGALRPLYEAGLGKNDLRELARFRGRSFSEKASGACLSSRIAPGLPVTVARLGKVETIESWLRNRGYVQFRARLDRENLVRIETSPVEIGRLDGELADEGVRAELLALARSVDLERVALDLTGYRRAGEA